MRTALIDCEHFPHIIVRKGLPTESNGNFAYTVSGGVKVPIHGCKAGKIVNFAYLAEGNLHIVDGNYDDRAIVALVNANIVHWMPMNGHQHCAIIHPAISATDWEGSAIIILFPGATINAENKLDTNRRLTIRYNGRSLAYTAIDGVGNNIEGSLVLLP